MNAKNLVLSLLTAAILLTPAAVIAADTQPTCPRMSACERPAPSKVCLTAEQKAQMEKMVSEHRAAIAPLREKIAQKRMELDALSPNPNTKPEELKAIVAEIVSLRKQIRTLQQDFRGKMAEAGLPCGKPFRGDCAPRGHRPDHAFGEGCGPRGFHGGHGNPHGMGNTPDCPPARCPR